jgi:lipoteichoic acid synthase
MRILISIAPVLIIAIILKCVRILRLPGEHSLLLSLDLLKSELIFYLTWFFFCALIARFFSTSHRGRNTFLFFLTLSSLIFLLVEFAAHLIFMEAGTVLDFSLLVFGFNRMTQIVAIVQHHASWGIGILLSCLIMLIVFGPRLIVQKTIFIRKYLVAFVFSFCLWALNAFHPTFFDIDIAMARNPMTHIIASAITELTHQVDQQKDQSKMVRSRTLERRLETQYRNVVIILLESTRARSVTPYNPALKTTPFLHQLAQDSLLARHAYSPIPHSSKALVYSLCGIDARISTKIPESEKPGAIAVPCLAQLLRDNGYRTAFFQAATENFENRRQLVENMGYEDFFPLEAFDQEGFEVANYFGLEDDVMLAKSEEWLQEKKGKPLFVTYFTVTPHFYCKPIKRYGRTKYHSNERFNDYLNAVTYIDHFVENIVNQFKSLGLYENSIFVVAGDHGEGFWEHNLWGHGDIIYEEGTHIPFLIHDPQKAQAGEVKELVSLLDIAPTVSDMLKFKVEGDAFPGYSLLDDIPDDRTLMFHCLRPRQCAASIKGGLKFIHHYGQREDEFFDLKNDPYERNDLFPVMEPHIIEERRQELLRWRKQLT